MDAVSQPAPARRRTPRRTYAATRVSHPNCSRFTCPATGLPSPLTHLWRPPAVARAGGHAQVGPWTAHGAAGQAPSSPDQAERAPGLPTAPQPRRRRHHPWWGRPAPRPPPTPARKRRPPSRRPGHSPPTDNPPGHPPSSVTSLGSPLPLSRGGTHRSPPVVTVKARSAPLALGAPTLRKLRVRTPTARGCTLRP